MVFPDVLFTSISLLQLPEAVLRKTNSISAQNRRLVPGDSKRVICLLILLSSIQLSSA